MVKYHDALLVESISSQKEGFISMSNWRSKRLPWSALLVGMLMTHNVCAVGPHDFLPPGYSTVDINLVDLSSSIIRMRAVDVEIGASGRKLGNILEFSFDPDFGSYMYGSDEWGVIQSQISGILSYEYTCATFGGTPSVELYLGAQHVERFCIVGGNLQSMSSAASKLVMLQNGSYEYVSADGTTYHFTASRLRRKVQPNGLITTYNYYTSPGGLERLQSISRNDSLQLLFRYVSDVVPVSPAVQAWAGWFKLTGVVAINSSVDYCDPFASSCSFSVPWPQSSYYETQVNSTDTEISIREAGGGLHQFFATSVGTGGPVVNGYKPPQSTNQALTYKYCQNIWITTQNPFVSDGVQTEYRFVGFENDPEISPDLQAQYGPGIETLRIAIDYSRLGPEVIYGPKVICAVLRDGGVWKYGFGPINVNEFSSFEVKFRAAPTGATASIATTVRSILGGYNAPLAPLSSTSDGNGKNYFYDTTNSYNRLKKISRQEGDYTSYYYDSRGNVESVIEMPKPGSVLGPLTRNANFDAACLYPAKCNKPNWIKDAMGNKTDFIYDHVHGGVLVETGPAPIASDPRRPQKRYTYGSYSAQVKNGGGQLQPGSPIVLLKSESFCRNSFISHPPPTTGPQCPAGDDVVTDYDYEPKNLFLRGVAVTADGVTRRTCYRYDVLGNKISETTANAGLTACP